jgi:hypothetical protein
MRFSSFDPIKVGEVVSLSCDFTSDVGANSIVSTNWVCSFVSPQEGPGAGSSDPLPQSRVLSQFVASSVSEREPDGALVTKTGYFSVAVFGNAPATAAGGIYFFVVSVTLSDGNTIEDTTSVPCVATTVPIYYLTSDQFRTDYPEFLSVEKYTTNAIDRWLHIGRMSFNRHRWGEPAPFGSPLSWFDFVVELFVAHHLVLQRRSQERAALGGPPGAQVGVMSSVGANGANVTYDTSVAINPDDGQWNLTDYGIQLVYWIRLAGMGPVQIGIGHAPFGQFQGPAWPGPDPSPGVFS